MTTDIKEKLNQYALDQFTGTIQYYKHWTGALNYTDGVHYVVEHGGAWIVDLIASYRRPEPFQVWSIKRTNEGGFIATMQVDTDTPILVTQEGEFTDLPIDVIMWLIDGVLILPSEY